MKIGLIADIHANLPALQAVLDDMQPVDKVVCVGDIVGYNPMPTACVDLIQSTADEIIQGNHDRMVETPERYGANRMAKAGLEYAQEVLTTEQREWLQSLPQQTTVCNSEYLVVHSHPEIKEEYVYPEDFSELRPWLDDYSGLILSHTHIQHTERFNEGVVINPGSVGQPRDGNPHAAYAILDTTANTVDLQRTYYNIDRVYHEIVIEDLPSETGERLFKGN